MSIYIHIYIHIYIYIYVYILCVYINIYIHSIYTNQKLVQRSVHNELVLLGKSQRKTNGFCSELPPNRDFNLQIPH